MYYHNIGKILHYKQLLGTRISIYKLFLVFDNNETFSFPIIKLQ